MLGPWRHIGYLMSLLVLAISSEAATPYKWSDSRGRVHYGDRPPPDQAVESVKVQPAPSSKSAPEPIPHAGDKSAEPGTGTSPQDQASAPNGSASSRQIMQENCNIARNNLSILTTSGRRVQAMGTDGKPYVLDDKEREMKLSETQEEIEKYCQ